MKLRHHSIMRCIYALLLALPMFSVFGRVIYTQSNSRANESYSGTQQVYEQQALYQTNEINDLSTDFVIGNIYKMDHFDFSDYSNSIFTMEVDILKCDNFLWRNFELDELYIEDNFISEYSHIYITINDDTRYITFYMGSESYIGFTFDSNSTLSFSNAYVVFYELDVQSFVSYDYSNLSIADWIPYEYVLKETSTLDNAFDYSLSKFVSDNDFGKLNLFQWFWSIFLTNNSQNMLYIHFVNWYMNYALLVSSAYILFLVLMWFINFSRRILERGMNYDW